jgi:hypothetical protein
MVSFSILLRPAKQILPKISLRHPKAKPIGGQTMALWRSFHDPRPLSPVKASRNWGPLLYSYKKLATMPKSFLMERTQRNHFEESLRYAG